MKSFAYKKLPETPGVYLMKDGTGRVLYVGKAGNLRRRVSSYFERPHLRQGSGGQAHDVRIEALVHKIKTIDYRQTDSALEALILEAELIKKLTPPFNVREKDDKSFLYVEITKEAFPRVLLVRGKDGFSGKRYGPFTSASSAREALKILRKIFPWNIHEADRVGTFSRPCFDREIGLCPGTCIGVVSHTDYMKNIGRLKLFLEGKKKKVIQSLEKEMKSASKQLAFEQAEKLRRQMFALRHIRDTALIHDSEVDLSSPSDPSYRIEGYDISNISGTSAVGSMVVFEGGEPNNGEYRKFKIRTVFQPDDVGMITEVLERRLHNPWTLPQLVLVDGGLAQANAAKKVFMRAGLRIPILGIAKGAERKRNDILGAIPKWTDKKTLIRVRNEAHRFAITYHKALRRVRTFA